MADDNDFLQGAQIGLGIAQQWAQRSARQQELRIQDAYRRMQERTLAAQAEEHLARRDQLRQATEQSIQQAADFHKAEAGYRIDTDPENPVGALGPGEAILKNYLPPIARYHPGSVPSLILDAAGTKQAADRALERQRNAAAGLHDERKHALQLKETQDWLEPEKSKAFTPSNTERVIKEAEARGIKFSQADLDEAFKVAAGVQPRERMAALAISKPAFIEKHLEKTLKNEIDNPSGPPGPPTGLIFKSPGKPTLKTRDVVIKELGDLYDTLYGQPKTTTSRFKNRDEVKAAYELPEGAPGKLSQEEAIKILNEQFGLPITKE